LAQHINMPALGFGIRQATVLRWLKETGEQVAEGEVLLEVETDKVTLEIESPAAGTLLRKLVDEEAEAAAGQPIAVIGEPGEEQAAEALALQPPETPPAAGRSLSRMRAAIAHVVAASKERIPHFYTTTAVEMTAALDFRRETNKALTEGDKVSLNDLIIKATALALRRVPQLNATFDGERLCLHERINIGIAVSTEDGLLMPVVPDCGNRSLVEIARETKAIVEMARTGRLGARQAAPGTFSITNLGMFPVEAFAAIIYPPQVAILAVGKVQEEPVVRGGEVRPGRILRGTLSCDHRAADGVDAARFLAEWKKVLESPAALAE